MKQQSFGATQNGQPVEQYTICNRNGLSATLMTLGAAVTNFRIPTRCGEKDVALGYVSPAVYEEKRTYFGATCGRFANRIAAGQFTLNGKSYTLATNDGPNHLHGGTVGFSFRIWDVADVQENAITFSTFSPDGEEGYPGNLRVSVTYSLDDENVFSIRYEALSDADTVLNLTNHTYWNLNGHDDGSILGHSLCIPASYFCPCDANALVTGEIVPVCGTPFDFTTPHTVGERIHADNEQLRFGKGYDHCFLLDGDKPITLKSDKTGIEMEITTDLPAVQLYTANYVNGHPGKEGMVYHEHSALCLETQQVPDAPNKPQFPSALLKANEPFVSVTAHRFTF